MEKNNYTPIKINKIEKLVQNKLLVILLIIITIIPSLYFYYRLKKTESKMKSVLGQKSPKEMTLEKVAKLIELPQGEVPTVAEISDKNKLQDQSFFINAKNGDQVLIYSNAKKVILYRPSTNKIIEVASINPMQTTPSTNPIKTPSKSPILSPKM